MPRIFFRKMFTGEDMAQVCAAIRTLNFCSKAVGIRQFLHGSRNFLIKTGPPAAGMEFIVRTIQLRITLLTNVRPLFEVIIVLTRKRRFGSLVLDDIGLLGG